MTNVHERTSHFFVLQCNANCVTSRVQRIVVDCEMLSPFVPFKSVLTVLSKHDRLQDIRHHVVTHIWFFGGWPTPVEAGVGIAGGVGTILVIAICVVVGILEHKFWKRQQHSLLPLAHLGKVAGGLRGRDGAADLVLPRTTADVDGASTSSASGYTTSVKPTIDVSAGIVMASTAVELLMDKEALSGGPSAL
jgi:hypothetical protein